MRYLATIGVLLMAATSLSRAADNQSSTAEFFPEVQKYIGQRAAEFDLISAERRKQLQPLASYVANRSAAGQPVRLTFICTHNSRRSQMAQIWAAAAARRFGIAGVETFSGGTETTAFNPRSLAAVKRAGLRVDVLSEGANPRYAVRFQPSGEPLTCFSKVYSAAPNPTSDFCAVMTCSQADESCPLVQGAALRVAVPYDDPKAADDTPQEAARYDERCAQISRELLYVFSQVKR
jgi:arsenate reductase